ncbi:MAG: outer membrane beta-barrel protein [Chthoniobacteraceae bacterium]
MKRLFISLLTLATLLPAMSARAGSSLSSSGLSAAQIEDLGDITEADESAVKSKFRSSVNVKGEFTSNALLTGNNSSNDFVFLPVVDFGYTQPLGPKFSIDLAAKIELGLYANHDERAFIGYSVKATLDYHPRPNLPRFYVGVEPYRYDSLDLGDRITQAIGFSAGTDWGYAFNNGHSLVFTGFSYTGYVADPTSDTRNTLKYVVGLSHQFRPDLTANVFYALQYNDFINFDRHDWKHVAGLNLIYQFHRDWFGTLSGAFADNDSDVNIATYQSVSGSLGLTYQF